MVTVSIKNVFFEYPDSNRIFHDINLELSSKNSNDSGGVIYVIMGISGCGKSTLLKLLANIEIPVKGNINITPAEALITYLPQDPVLFEHLSREENAKYYKYIQKLQPYYDESSFKKFKNKLKLDGVLASNSSVLNMSGGERQRLALLRAISVKPKILLLDEPCTGLDISVKLEFLNLIRQITDELGLIVLYVTHHMHEAKLIGDKILYVKKEGEECAKVLLSSIFDFEKIPPSLEAALLINGVELNYCDCEIIEGKIRISKDNFTIGTITSDTTELPTCCKIAFPANTINYSNNCGVPVKIIGESEKYLFMTFNFNEESESPIIKGPNLGVYPTKVIVTGNVFLYDRNGQNPHRINLNNTFVN